MTDLEIPKRVFIVPYRNRKEHKFFFCNQMTFILEDKSDYEIYFSHQCDERQFNRGATKNIGFLSVKEKYPNDYKNITFIFNDVDTLPFHKIFDYDTTEGIIKHYYGFTYALGGIVVIKGSDFEKTNGYPNYWGWGNEDSVFQKRCLLHNLQIDRTHFFQIGSPEILQLFDGVKRLVSPREYLLGQQDSGLDGLSSLHRINFSIDNESLNPQDNLFVVNNKKIKIINILSFLSAIRFAQNDFYTYDLRNSTQTIVKPVREQYTKQRVTTTDDWKNISNDLSTSLKYTSPKYIYSKQYAQQNNIKPRATSSANIRLGGIF